MATIHPKPITTKSREGVWHQRNQDHQRSGKIIDSPDIRPQQTRQGTVLYLKRFRNGGGSVNVRRCNVVNYFNDTLLVRDYKKDGTLNTSGDPFTVAKDPTYRGVSPRSTQITSPLTTTIQETLTPPYAIGDDIYVIFGVGADTDLGDDNGDPIDALEIAPARAWVPALKAVCVRVAGVDKQMLVFGSDPIAGP